MFLSLLRHYKMVVVMAADGYPGGYAKGEEIKGLEKADAREVGMRNRLL